MNYSKEFKTEALKLSDELGVKKAAQQLGIQYYTLADWRKNRKAKANKVKSEMSDEEVRRRNLELEKENAQLREEVEILKKAAAFLANVKRD